MAVVQDAAGTLGTIGGVHMKNTITEYLFRLKKIKRKQHRYYGAVLLLSVIVTVGIGWNMRLDGITLAGDAYCGMEEHKHTEACWEERVICDLEESQGHTHSVEQGCYEEKKILNCAMDHEHTEECYKTEQVLVCTQEECEGHQHTEACRERVQICKKEEHIHDISCYADLSADVENASEWEKTLPSTLSGIWADDLIAVAESQIGYRESERNYIVDLGGNRKGYTRYGQWYDSCYDKWDSMFVSWCLHYAEIDEETVPYGMNCQNMLTHMQEKNLYTASAGYTPLPGDIVFLDLNEDGTADHTGIVKSVTENSIKTIEGDSDDRVQKEEHGLADRAILGYCTLPQNPKLIVQKPNEVTAPEETAPHITIPEETIPENQGYPFHWGSSECDYVYQGNYKNSYYKVTMIGEETPITVGAKVLVPGDATQPWSPDRLPWVPGSSNYQVAYGVDVAQDPTVATGYRVENLMDTEHLTKTQKASLSRIIMHSYPFISEVQMVKEMQGAGVDVSGINISEMISGTQQAIWKSVNEIDCMDSGEVFISDGAENTQILPLQSAEMGESHAARSQMSAQKVKDYLLGLPSEDTCSAPEIQQMIASEVYENEEGIDVVSLQIVLNRSICEHDKNLELTVSWAGQEQKLNLHPGDQEVEVILKKVAPGDNVEAKLTGSTENLWQLNYYVGYQKDTAESDNVQHLVGGYPKTEEIASTSQVEIPQITEIPPVANRPSYAANISSDVEHHKTIDAFRDGVDNPDTTLDNTASDKTDLYRLYLTAKADDVKGIDFLFVVDASGSMGNYRDVEFGSHGKVRRDTAVTIALNGSQSAATSDGMISQALSMHEDNQVAVIKFFGNTKASSSDYTYKTDSKIILDWTKRKEFANAKNNSNNGTNYEAGLSLADEMLNKVAHDGRKKVMIFLSDGVPTLFEIDKSDWDRQNQIKYNGKKIDFSNKKVGDRWGNGSYSKPDNVGYCKLPSKWAFDEFKEKHPDVTTYTIGISKDINGTNPSQSTSPEVLKYYAEQGGGKFIGVTGGDELIDEIGKIITGQLCQNLVISDTLSENVKLHGKQPDIKVTMEKDREKIVLYQNGSVTRAGKGILKNVEVKGNTISAIFEPGVAMKGGYTYTLSFNVETTQKAYDTYAKNGYGGQKGDPNTDYGKNSTSSNQPGFHSNSKAFVSYQQGGKTNELVYQHPVIQVDSCSLKIRKQSSEGAEALQGAKFKLYREAQDGSELLEQLPGVKLKEVPGEFTTGRDGNVTINALSPATYYLVETKSPDGYKLLEKPVRISLTRHTVMVEDDTGLIEGSSESVEVPTLTVKNKPGYQLPETGGNGTLLYTLGGMFLMVVPLMCCVNGCRKPKKGVK